MIKLKNLKKKKNIKFCTILVSPEGFYSETKIMLDFTRNILENFKNIKIIFRSHPVLNLKKLKKYFGKNILNKNFCFSQNSLENDIKKSQLLLYRGSGVCIKASLFGLIPINLKFKNEDSLDPLFQVNSNVISNIKDLKNILFKYTFSNTKNQNNFNLKKIQNYCLKYYTPFKLNKLLKFLKRK